MSKVYGFKQIQIIPTTLPTAWSFFSDSGNLQHITPAGLQFKVTSKPYHGKMYPGQVIEYTINPLFGIPVYWMTEITHVEDQSYFVDEQRFGPYSFWHHQHHFKETGAGVEMTDIIHYKIPYWFIGDMINLLFVRRRLREIFEYRRDKIISTFKLFGN